MTDSQKQSLLADMVDQIERRENDFPTINSHGQVEFPVLNKHGIVIAINSADTLKGYKGYALEINDHGNVTVWNCFKNGNRREIVSRV